MAVRNGDGNVSGQGNGPGSGDGNGQESGEGSGAGSGWRAVFSDPPRALLAIAAGVLGLGVGFGVCSHMGMGGGWSGWGIGLTTYSTAGYAVYPPGVVLGLVALLLVRSDERRGDAARMIRLVKAAAALMALAGLAGAVSIVGQDLSNEFSSQSGWWTASFAFTCLAGALFDCGVLLGLVYIFRQLERKYAARQSCGQEMPDAAPPAAEGSQG